jgi:hypothetical protein
MFLKNYSTLIIIIMINGFHKKYLFLLKQKS